MREKKGRGGAVGGEGEKIKKGYIEKGASMDLTTILVNITLRGIRVRARLKTRLGYKKNTTEQQFSKSQLSKVTRKQCVRFVCLFVLGVRS